MRAGTIANSLTNPAYAGDYVYRLMVGESGAADSGSDPAGAAGAVEGGGGPAEP